MDSLIEGAEVAPAVAPTSSFLALPRELRNQIYEELLYANPGFGGHWVQTHKTERFDKFKFGLVKGTHYEVSPSVDPLYTCYA